MNSANMPTIKMPDVKCDHVDKRMIMHMRTPSYVKLNILQCSRMAIGADGCRGQSAVLVVEVEISRE